MSTLTFSVQLQDAEKMPVIEIYRAQAKYKEAIIRFFGSEDAAARIFLRYESLTQMYGQPDALPADADPEEIALRAHWLTGDSVGMLNAFPVWTDQPNVKFELDVQQHALN